MKKKGTGKLIAMYSAQAQSGQTTLANTTALNLAKQGYYTLVIELSKKTGYSVFLNQTLSEEDKGLKHCLLSPENFKENIVRSSLDHKLYILCQNITATILDLNDSYSSEVSRIIQAAQELFDIVILDIPNTFESDMALTILSKDYKFDHLFYTITDNVMSVKVLNEFDNLLAKMNNTAIEDRQRTTLLVNKSRGYYSEYFENLLKNMQRAEIVNILSFREIQDIVYLGNEGKIYSMGDTPASRDFFDGITTMSEIISKGLIGHGVTLDKETDITRKLKGARLLGGKSDENKDLTDVKKNLRRSNSGMIPKGSKGSNTGVQMTNEDVFNSKISGEQPRNNKPNKEPKQKKSLFGKKSKKPKQPKQKPNMRPQQNPNMNQPNPQQGNPNMRPPINNRPQGNPNVNQPQQNMRPPMNNQQHNQNIGNPNMNNQQHNQNIGNPNMNNRPPMNNQQPNNRQQPR